MSNKPPLVIERLVVRADRIVCDVVVDPSVSKSTTPAFAEEILKAFPNLVYHTCINDEGDTFGAVLDHTSLPHVLEHLVIDMQTAATSADATTVFVGTTEWTDVFSGRARIEVNFTDDLVALRCFQDALKFLNERMVL